MSIDVKTYCIKSSQADEIYITAVPQTGQSSGKQAQQLFSAIKDILLEKNASILQERIFVTNPAVEEILKTRSKIYDDLDDGVTPACLLAQREHISPIVGVQVHAIRSDNRPETFEIDRKRCGRIIRLAKGSWLTVSGVDGGANTQTASEQARTMFENTQAAMKRFGSDFHSVSRTWMWLGDVLSWYSDFNHVRNTFFSEIGISGKDGRQKMPASTGIGLGPVNGLSCSMDLFAVIQPPNSTEFLNITHKQLSAFKYGSAFSRAAKTVTPAGQTVFVSGTAAIDAAGATTHIGDNIGQINATMDNVRAVLEEMQCSEKDIVHAVAYCKTQEVEDIFMGIKRDMDWPFITAVCDICRPELLFEIEVTAVVSK